MKKYLEIIVLIVIGLLIYNFLFKPDTWQGAFYPDESNLFVYEQSPWLSSYDECLSWVDSRSDFYGLAEGYDYECSKNCDFDKFLKVYVCEETLN